MADQFRPLPDSEQEKIDYKAHEIVINYIEAKRDKSDPRPQYGVFTVWFCKTLQNWKALVSTTIPDSMYYEVTYNGDNRVTYLDAYKKWENVVIPDPVAPPTGEVHPGYGPPSTNDETEKMAEWDKRSH